MKDFMKGMLTVLAILYIVSPLDGCPGPIDDVIVLLVTAALNRGGDRNDEYLD